MKDNSIIYTTTVMLKKKKIELVPCLYRILPSWPIITDPHLILYSFIVSMMTWSNKSIVSSTVSFGQRVPIKD